QQQQTLLLLIKHKSSMENEAFVESQLNMQSNETENPSAEVGINSEEPGVNVQPEHAEESTLDDDHGQEETEQKEEESKEKSDLPAIGDIVLLPSLKTRGT
ncbi:unnamed protein product, partial [Heterosigma akashiwo]